MPSDDGKTGNTQRVNCEPLGDCGPSDADERHHFLFCCQQELLVNFEEMKQGFVYGRPSFEVMARHDSQVPSQASEIRTTAGDARGKPMHSHSCKRIHIRKSWTRWTMATESKPTEPTTTRKLLNCSGKGHKVPTQAWGFLADAAVGLNFQSWHPQCASRCALPALW